MKVLDKQKVIREKLERFVRSEKDILSMLNHPFLVSLKYSFQNDKSLFMVMEYCSGGDLGKLLAFR